MPKCQTHVLNLLCPYHPLFPHTDWSKNTWYAANYFLLHKSKMKEKKNNIASLIFFHRRKSSRYARYRLNTTGEFSHFTLKKNQKFSHREKRTNIYQNRESTAGISKKGCIQKKRPYIFFSSKPLLRRRTLTESTISAYCTKWLVSTSG